MRLLASYAAAAAVAVVFIILLFKTGPSILSNENETVSSPPGHTSTPVISAGNQETSQPLNDFDAKHEQIQSNHFEKTMIENTISTPFGLSKQKIFKHSVEAVFPLEWNSITPASDSDGLQTGLRIDDFKIFDYFSCLT